MNGWELLNTVGLIDDGFVQEAAEAPAAGNARRRRAVAAAACVAAAVSAAVFFALRGLPRTTPQPAPGEEGSVVYETPSGGGTASPITESAAGESAAGQPTSAASAGPSPTTEGSTPSPVTEPSREASEPSQAATDTTERPSAQDGEASGARPGGEETAADPATEGGSFGGPPVPEQWSPAAPAAKGTGYTPQEIDALLARDAWPIAQTVAAETGCAPEDVRVCPQGYCHTSLGEENRFDLDYLTLPVCVGETVVASVDLFRVDGEIHWSLSAGGPRWDNLNRALRYGEVAFAYAGFGEVAVAADGAVFPITVGAEEAVAGLDGLYERIAAPQTVYSLARLRAALREAG